MSRTRVPARGTLLGAGLVLALLVVMALNTRFVTPEELAGANPAAFDPADVAGELITDAPAQLTEQAAPVADVVVALQRDVAGAAEQFDAVQPNQSTFVFVVSGTGTVDENAGGTLRLRFDGVPASTTVTVPTTTAINGAVVRDALGFRFSDAPDQSNFQFVGDELKALMQDAVAPAAEQVQPGDQVSVVGALSVVATDGGQPAAKPVSIQAVSLEVA